MNFVRIFVCTVVLSTMGRVPPHGGSSGRGHPAAPEITTLQHLPPQLAHARLAAPPFPSLPERRDPRGPTVVHCYCCNVELARSTVAAAAIEKRQGKGGGGKRAKSCRGNAPRARIVILSPSLPSPFSPPYLLVAYFSITLFYT